MSGDPFLVELLHELQSYPAPVNVTLSELALESFFPADAATAAALRELLPKEG